MVNQQQVSEVSRPKIQPHRPTIGLLTRGVSNEIGASLWAGVAAAAAAHDANLLTFAGGSLYFPHGFEAQGNVIYDLVDPALIDGLLLDGGDLSHYISLEGLQLFCERYQGLPLVTIEAPLSGIPTVLVDFYQGMRQVIDHLIEVHHYRRIAFIRGPQESFTAEERYRAYCDALTEHGLPLEPDLVVPGTFHIPSGEEGVKLLLDERRVKVEAIAAANDFMAVDAIQTLQARHLRVPADIAVVGFDDLEMARVVNPPLTTARLHNYERARLGAELLLAQLRGETVPLLTTIPAELVVRQSCGCLTPALTQAGSGEAWVTATIQPRDEMLAEMVRVVDSINPEVDWARADQLLAGFREAIEGHQPGHGLLRLEQILTEVAAGGGEVGKWHGALTVLRRWLLAHLAEAETVVALENLLHRARQQISETVERFQAQRRLQHERQVHILSQIGQAVMTTLDTAELMGVIAQELPRLGIPSGYLSLYQNPDAPTAEARLILAFNETGRIAMEVEGRPFPAWQLLPTGMLPAQRRYSMIILPLYFRQDQLGFMLLEISLPDTTAYELLRGQISSALKGALLLQARQEAEKALAKALAEVEQQVNERTGELQQEIAERSQVENALRDSESRFRAIFEMAGVGVALSTLEGKLLETNPAFRQMMGYTAAELKHLSVLDVTHPADVKDEVQAVRAALSTQPPSNFQAEKRYIHRNGQSIWGRLTLSFITDNQGQPRYGLAVVENITEQKRSEAQLKAYAAELERSNRELQDFAYIASHDLQEPLRKIQAFGERLQSRYHEQLDERGLDYLERMQSAVTRMQRLIQDLLTYSRVTTKAQPFTPVELNGAVKEVLADLETRLEEVGGRVELVNLPTIEADRTQMQQLFQNLISNALKFHKAGQAPLVRIEAELLPETIHDVQLCQITVQDNGIGFDEKYLDRIFGVFQRLHGRASYEGSGIGLALCRKIVERHRGRLTARSKAGEGATFIVTLPVKQIQGGPQN